MKQQGSKWRVLKSQNSELFDRLPQLEAKLGYAFKDQTLLYEALTHRSAVAQRGSQLPWNERLEFLGDSVLNLSVTARLWKSAPQFSEGQLSLIRSTLVDETSLAEIARDYELRQYLLLGNGESDADERDALLADALEAIVGAVYADSDFVTAEKVVVQMYGHRLVDLPSPTRDPRTELQEWTQAQWQQAPSYEVISTEGPAHDRTFVVEVQLLGKTLGSGQGKSKKRACRDAARKILAEIAKEPGAGN